MKCHAFGCDDPNSLDPEKAVDLHGYAVHEECAGEGEASTKDLEANA